MVHPNVHFVQYVCTVHITVSDENAKKKNGMHMPYTGKKPSFGIEFRIGYCKNSGNLLAKQNIRCMTTGWKNIFRIAAVNFRVQYVLLHHRVHNKLR